jgi:ferredoxin
MAERLRANAFGRYYVTGDCDGCGDCVETAPMNFAFSSDKEYCAVHAQPEEGVEEERVREVMEACPLDAVRDDGDEL